jgi:hypothetical protein
MIRPQVVNDNQDNIVITDFYLLGFIDLEENRKRNQQEEYQQTKCRF